MKKEEVIQKIRKCLALSKSANEHEAAAALRQAQALMRKHQVDNDDLLAAEVSKETSKSQALVKPTIWESRLAKLIADAFGCHVIFSPAFSILKESGTYEFIGCGVSPQIAKYGFDVLIRQLKKQRAQYIKTKLKRCKVSTKTRRADLFCEGWIQTATDQLEALTQNDTHKRNIAAYMTKNHENLKILKPNDRNGNKKSLSNRDYGDYHNGAISGNDAKLNVGVSTQKQDCIEG